MLGSYNFYTQKLPQSVQNLLSETVKQDIVFIGQYPLITSYDNNVVHINNQIDRYIVRENDDK